MSKSLVAAEKSVQETRKQKNKGEKGFLNFVFFPSGIENDIEYVPAYKYQV